MPEYNQGALASADEKLGGYFHLKIFYTFQNIANYSDAHIRTKPNKLRRRKSKQKVVNSNEYFKIRLKFSEK